MRRLFLLIGFIAASGWGQTTPSSLLVTRIFNISGTWSGECAPGVINNQSAYSRQNNFHTVYATGSGSWTVALTYSDTGCSGPWTSFAPSISNLSPAPVIIAIGFHKFLKLTIAGQAAATYAAVRDFFPAGSGGGGGGPASTDQLSEGGVNLYFTAQRAQDANTAALALKAPLANPTFVGLITMGADGIQSATPLAIELGGLPEAAGSIAHPGPGQVLYFSNSSDGNRLTRLNEDGSTKPVENGPGSTIVYRCATAGTLPSGALTITAGNCGTTADTGLRVQ